MQPDWFSNAIASKAESKTTSHANAKIHYLHWPNTGKPGLVLVHGHAAHAHWWDFIAPMLKSNYDIIAPDLSGCGDSDHRSSYSAELFAEEIRTCAQAAELIKPMLVGHSFGGAMSRISAHLFPEVFSGLVIADSMISTRRGNRTPPTMPRSKTRYYKTLKEGMRRFRLRPPQPSENKFVLNYIAAHSLRETDQGFVFKLDPATFAKMPNDSIYPAASDMVKSLSIPVGFIYGKKSRFFPESVVDGLTEIFDPRFITAIPNAHHHVFVDQPLRFVDALDKMLGELSNEN